jgi:uncharacterized protein YkwD
MEKMRIRRKMLFVKMMLVIVAALFFHFGGRPFYAAADEIQQWLDAHNQYRALHGVPPVTWSADLATSAQNWADTCPATHSGWGYGENILWATYTLTPQEVVTFWYNEESDYDYSNPGYYENPGTGHFTQVVWKNTTEIGCGFRSGCTDSIYPYVWVCQYNPPGNVLGEFAENVLPPGEPSKGICPGVLKLLLE